MSQGLMPLRLCEAVDLLLDRPELPDGVEYFRWFIASPGATSIEVEATAESQQVEAWRPDTVIVSRQIQERHGGFAFDVGWDGGAEVIVLFPHDENTIIK